MSILRRINRAIQAWNDVTPKHVDPLSVNGECDFCFDCIGKRPAFDAATYTIAQSRMILCHICGNKRCPHSTNHNNPCTNSNDVNQPGSRYGGR